MSALAAEMSSAQSRAASLFRLIEERSIVRPGQTEDAISRAIGRDLEPGDEILVTRLEHDANVSPWLAMAEDRGVTVRWAEIHDEDCTLDMADLASKIHSKTKLVSAG